jgi:hypothetical protein
MEYSMNDLVGNIQSLMKTLEAGGYNAAPGTLVQGAALQIEDLSPVMQNVTFGEEHLKLQKVFKVEPVKGNLAQFDRQLSYGQFGGSAQLEGAVGQDETSDFVRVVVPMCYYSHVRRVTVVANMVQTVDGMKAEERAASDAAKKIAADIEFDLFRGKADFTNAGVYDGNPLAMPVLPNILGLDPQIRVSDAMVNSQDLMFNEFGSNLSIVINCGAVLNQFNIEDAHVRSAMNMGSAERLIVDPIALSQYNKVAIAGNAVSPLTNANIQRIPLAGSPQDAVGADLRRQWTSGGVVNLEASRFLSGKTTWARTRPTAPAAPGAIAAPVVAAGGTIPASAGGYIYVVTACNEAGESAPTAATVTAAVTATDRATITIPAVTGAKFYNVYRGSAGAVAGPAGTAKFIGRISVASAGGASFVDLGNKLPAFVTGYLLQTDTAGMKELAPYSRLKLAVSDLSVPEAHFRFTTLAVYQPRKNVLLDNLPGF